MKHFITQSKTNNIMSGNDFCVRHLFLPEDYPVRIEKGWREIWICNNKGKLMCVTFIE
jgi:hypothetical protein